MRHEWPVRVYYEDTDAGGVMYHGRYLNFADRARTELLRACCVSLSEADNALGVLFMVRRINITYLKPIMLDDSLVVVTRQRSATATRAQLQQVFERDGTICAEMHVELVCVSRKLMRPVAFPGYVREALRLYAVDESARDARAFSS